MHVLGSCEASTQYSPINFFVYLLHSKTSNIPYCFGDLIHTEYRKLHKINDHSPFFGPPIMRPSVGQCRNIRFRQLYARHVIITSDKYQLQSNTLLYTVIMTWYKLGLMVLPDRFIASYLIYRNYKNPS